MALIKQGILLSQKKIAKENYLFENYFCFAISHTTKNSDLYLVSTCVAMTNRILLQTFDNNGMFQNHD